MEHDESIEAIIQGPVQLRMGRVTGYSDEVVWRLTIIDEASRLTVASITMDDAQLGRLLGCTPVVVDDAEIMRSSLHGKYHHNCTVRVPLPESLTFNKYSRVLFHDHVHSILLDRGWDMDLWKIDVGDWNSHRWNGGQYMVVLRAWTDDPEGPPRGND